MGDVPRIFLVGGFGHWTMPADRPELSPSKIGSYFKLDDCEMFLGWEYHEDAETRAENYIDTTKYDLDSSSLSEVGFNELSPLLREKGDEYERTQLEALTEDGSRFVTTADREIDIPDRLRENWPSVRSNRFERLKDIIRDFATESIDHRYILDQAYLRGTIGEYDISGDADIILLEPTPDGFVVDILEIKLSGEVSVHHQAQGAIYSILFEQLLDDLDVAADDTLDREAIETRVVHPANDLTDDDWRIRIEPFRIAPFRTQLQLKLREGHEFDELLLDNSVDELRSWINNRCAGCKYEPLCVAQEVSEENLGLLGFTPGTQASLNDDPVNIDSLEDFYRIYEQPASDSDPTNFSSLDQTGAIDPSLGREATDVNDLQKQTQITYRFLSQINSDHSDRVGGDYLTHYLRGSGYNLPRDSHWANEAGPTGDGPDFPNQGLTRVYIYTHLDPVLKRIGLMAALVENAREDGGEECVIVVGDNLGHGLANRDRFEEELIEEFFTDLKGAIEEVAPDLSDIDYASENTIFPHLYFYSYHQRDVLVEAIKRSSDIAGGKMMRKLLGLREGIDQQMVSILRQEFRQRHALRFTGLGIVQATAQFRVWEDGWNWFDWTNAGSSGLDLTQTFKSGLFDSTVSHGGTSGGLDLELSEWQNAADDPEHRLAQWEYPVRHRETDSIPPEYLWGITGELSDIISDESEIAPYKYHDPTASSPEEIAQGDLELLAEHFCRGIRHIERGVNDKSAFIEKDFFDKPDLLDLAPAAQTLSGACIEYQQLEFDSKKQDRLSHYRQPLGERLDTGRSVAFECIETDNPEEADEDDRTPFIDGRILTSNLELFDPGNDNSPGAAPLSVSEGSFMVLTRLRTDDEMDAARVEADNPDEVRREAVYDNNPEYIQKHTTVIVDSIDFDEAAGHARISLAAPFHFGWPNGDDPFTVNHFGWTGPDAPDNDYDRHVSDGQWYVLDPILDSINEGRANHALRYAQNNPTYRDISEVFEGSRIDLPYNAVPDIDAGLEDYVDRIDANDDLGSPEEDQRALITETGSSLVTLQGPPGTGKTSYTIAPAVLGRIHAAMEAAEAQVSVVSALSHDAVNEALEKVADIRDACPPGSNDEVELIRVCSSESQQSDAADINIVYHRDEDQDRIEDLVEEYLIEPVDDKYAVFFGPPGSIRSLIDRQAELFAHAAGVDPESIAGTGILAEDPDEEDEPGVEDLLRRGLGRCFDFGIVDEASMMDLPLFFLLTAFVRERSQMILVGDHRQMQPIQKHDWAREDRQQIEENTPFLSTLNFIRFLREDDDVDIDFIEQPSPEVPDDTIPTYKLRITRRLPQAAADMHTDLFYREDGIGLISENAELPLDPTTFTPPDEDHALVEDFDPESRITLLTYQDQQARKSNDIERALISTILDTFPEAITTEDGEEEEIEFGVVVPFRAHQRAVTEDVPDDVLVNTVEKFQGGEKDVIIVSMAASDPGYVNQVSDFILDPNRFNVAASRMKRHVFIIASRAIFSSGSDSVEEFDRQAAWKYFYRGIGAMDGYSDYRGTLSDFAVDTGVPSRDPEIRMYCGYEPHGPVGEEVNEE